MGAYLYSSRQKFIATERINIVFYLFLAVFFLVYVTLSVISILRQSLKPQIFSRTMTIVKAFCHNTSVLFCLLYHWSPLHISIIRRLDDAYFNKRRLRIATLRIKRIPQFEWGKYSWAKGRVYFVYDRVHLLQGKCNIMLGGVLMFWKPLTLRDRC